jgi:hypothetical protein
VIASRVFSYGCSRLRGLEQQHLRVSWFLLCCFPCVCIFLADITGQVSRRAWSVGLISLSPLGSQRARWASSHTRPDRGRSSPFVAGGPPSHCAIKRRWGPAAQDTRITAAATPPTVLNPSRSSGSAIATGRLIHSRHRPRRLILMFPCGDPKDDKTYIELRLPQASPSPEAMAGSSAAPPMQGHDGMITNAPSPLSLSLSLIV